MKDFMAKGPAEGEPVPATGTYEQVKGYDAWTGVQRYFVQGEATPRPMEGHRWVWIEPLVSDCRRAR